jgi:hypothetical protein
MEPMAMIHMDGQIVVAVVCWIFLGDCSKSTNKNPEFSELGIFLLQKSKFCYTTRAYNRGFQNTIFLFLINNTGDFITARHLLLGTEISL